jgi:hypothetical protein
VSSKLYSKFLFGEHTIFDLLSFLLGLRYRAGSKAELYFFSALVVCDVRCWDTLHAEDFDFISIPSRQCIVNTRQCVSVELVHLLDVDRQTTSRIEPTRAHAALEMLGLLMLHQNLLILELSFTVPAPWPDNSLLLAL